MTVELVAQSQPSQAFARFTAIDTTGAIAGVRAFSSGTLSSPVTTSVQSLALRAYWPSVTPTNSLVLNAVRINYTINSPLP
jgi:hypothetical protein